MNPHSSTLPSAGMAAKDPSSSSSRDAHSRETPTPPAIDVRGITHVFVSKRGASPALQGIDLTVPRSQFLSIVGPSGCGKSTLLSIMGGLVRPTAGDLYVEGHPVKSLVPDLGFAFQGDALLPWRTAEQNVALPLRIRGTGKKEALDEARRWLARVGLAGHERQYPSQLSGGMRKRVSIAVAMVYSPSVLLMDEPYSALDVQTRNIMENQLLSLWRETRQTVVFVTHDLEEAVGLSERVIVLSASPGRIVADYTIDLPWPRNLLDIRSESNFSATYAMIWQDLRREVVRASMEEQ